MHDTRKKHGWNGIKAQLELPVYIIYMHTRTVYEKDALNDRAINILAIFFLADGAPWGHCEDYNTEYGCNPNE